MANKDVIFAKKKEETLDLEIILMSKAVKKIEEKYQTQIEKNTKDYYEQLKEDQELEAAKMKNKIGAVSGMLGMPSQPKLGAPGGLPPPQLPMMGGQA